MSWAKLHDRFHENRKIRAIWVAHPAALGLHVMGLTYCAGNETDGFVDELFVTEKVPLPATRKKLAAALVDHGLWLTVPGGWEINDYLEFNPSRADLEGKRDAVRTAKSAAGRKGAEAKWAKARTDDEAVAAGDGSRMAPAMPLPVSENGSRPDPTPTTGANAPVEPTRLDNAARRLKSESVQTVFDEWVESTGRTGRTVLDEKRRRIIRRALEAYPVDEVVAAVRGWRNSPHHRGDNNTGTTYNDLELLLRDPAHIEKFRDLAGSSKRTDVKAHL